MNTESDANQSRQPIVRVGKARRSELDFVFGSAAEAISHFQNNTRRLQAEAAFKAHRDAVITGVAYGANHAHFLLSDQTWLRMTLRGDTLDWEFVATAGEQALMIGEPPPEVRLLFGNNREPWFWDRARLLEGRIGRRAVNFSAGIVNLFVYCHGYPTLRFGPLLNADTGSEFLFWCETN